MTQKKLIRSRDDKWFAGVCGGLEAYTGIDATLWRIGAVVATILTGVFPVVLGYVIAWMVIPKADKVTWTTATAPTSPPPAPPSL